MSPASDPAILPPAGKSAPLAERVALVTGASRGIGRAIAERLASQGAHVFVNFRRAAKEASACVRQIRQRGASAEAIRADVASPQDVARMFKSIERQAGRLDILVA